MHVHIHSFRPAAGTWLLALARQRDRGQFHPECLLIPTLEVTRISRVDGEYLRFAFEAAVVATPPLSPYRRPLADLGTEGAGLLV